MDKRVAVVIGGASGIGKAAAIALHDCGFQVTIGDRDGPGAAAVAAEIDGTSEVGDVTDEAGIAALLDRVVDREGAVHAVVNTAGTSTWSPIVDHDVSEWRRIVDINLVGAFIVAKHAARTLTDGGALVSLTSLNARQAGAGLSAYCAAKAGLSMLTQVAALELGSRRIRVNAIAPGLVITPLTEGVALVPGVTEDYVQNTPLGRSGTPEEIAAAVVYLCSDGASWITGEVLDINGGAHLMRYPDLPKHIASLQ